MGLCLERKPGIYGLYNSNCDSSDLTDSAYRIVGFNDMLLDPLIDSLFEVLDLFRYFDASITPFCSLKERDCISNSFLNPKVSPSRFFFCSFFVDLMSLLGQLPYVSLPCTSYYIEILF